MSTGYDMGGYDGSTAASEPLPGPVTPAKPARPGESVPGGKSAAWQAGYDAAGSTCPNPACRAKRESP